MKSTIMNFLQFTVSGVAFVMGWNLGQYIWANKIEGKLAERTTKNPKY